jgi:ABC-2 type transport system ATP-binding protein
MSILEVKNLKKYYATQKAVDDVSFSLAPGSIFGLLGPNGAGKTTLIRMITGIFFPDEGELLLNGKKFDPLKDLTMIGYMPEERGLYKKMKIGEQAVYLAQLKGLSKHDATEKVKEWFVRFEMQSWWNKKVEDLSKEPFSGLDPVNSNLIKEEIYNLAKKGASIIFSTHRMEQVEEICDHIILMNRGKKILDGTVRQVKQQYKENLYTVSFETITDENTSDAFEIIQRKEHQHIVKIRNGYSTNDVLEHYLGQKTHITGFQEILPSLNDIFIKVVEGTPVSRQFQQVTA